MGTENIFFLSFFSGRVCKMTLIMNIMMKTSIVRYVGWDVWFSCVRWGLCQVGFFLGGGGFKILTQLTIDIILGDIYPISRQNISTAYTSDYKVALQSMYEHYVAPKIEHFNVQTITLHLFSFTIIIAYLSMREFQYRKTDPQRKWVYRATLFLFYVPSRCTMHTAQYIINWLEEQMV